MEARLAPLTPFGRRAALDADRLDFADLPSIALDVSREAFELARRTPAGSPTRPAGRERARRLFDVAAASVLLVVLSPLLLLIALAIRFDSRGPVLYRQRRLGQHAIPFTILKFRSMRQDACDSPHKEFATRMIIDGDVEPCGTGDAPVYKISPDPRVTRVGRVLRGFSLDELPQLWNVLRGDMSLVGFRPPIPYEVECYPEWYYGRFFVKPGITGLWQVSGRNEKTYDEMVAFDIEYAERRSWKLDALLLVKTVGVVAVRRGAC